MIPTAPPNRAIREGDVPPPRPPADENPGRWPTRVSDMTASDVLDRVAWFIVSVVVCITTLSTLAHVVTAYPAETAWVACAVVVVWAMWRVTHPRRVDD